MTLFRETYCALYARMKEDESHVLFSCKAYEDFRKRRVVVRNGSHTAAVADLSYVMSADDETSIWEVSRFFCTKFCKGETTL